MASGRVVAIVVMAVAMVALLQTTTCSTIIALALVLLFKSRLSV